MNNELFLRRLKDGVEGEKEVANIFLNLGYSLMPMYQFKNLNESPKIYSDSISTVSPDLILFKNNKTVFIEVKKKTKWIRNNKTLETGCDYRLYQEYLKIAQQTKIKLILVFNHIKEEPTGIFYVDINTVGRYWDGTFRGKEMYSPMYFFNYEQLKKIK